MDHEEIKRINVDYFHRATMELVVALCQHGITPLGSTKGNS